VSVAPDARVALRARSVLESADLALRFTMVHIRPVAVLSALVALPGLASGLALRYVAGLSWVVVWSVSLALAGIAEGPFTVLFGRLALGTEATAREALTGFRARAIVYSLVLFAALVFQLAAASILLMPWVFAALATVFVPEVALLEGARMASIRRSLKVTTGFTGRVFGVVAVLLLSRLAIVGLADDALRRTIGMVLDLRIRTESLFEDGGSPYALVGLWLSVPVCASIRYFQYIDLRTIKEGWDLQRRFQLLAARLHAEAAQ
jgi:hypothetical protein